MKIVDMPTVISQVTSCFIFTKRNVLKSFTFSGHVGRVLKGHMSSELLLLIK